MAFPLLPWYGPLTRLPLHHKGQHQTPMTGICTSIFFLKEDEDFQSNVHGHFTCKNLSMVGERLNHFNHHSLTALGE
jgi:hypothetical protein